MWNLESLVLLYALGGIAVWTWVIRDRHPRARQRARGADRLRKRRRTVEGVGVGVIALVALMAAVVGLVDANGVAFVVAALVGCAQLLSASAFSQRLLTVRGW